jgi:hypothetical protein
VVYDDTGAGAYMVDHDSIMARAVSMPAKPSSPTLTDAISGLQQEINLLHEAFSVLENKAEPVLKMVPENPDKGDAWGGSPEASTHNNQVSQATVSLRALRERIDGVTYRLDV